MELIKIYEFLGIGGGITLATVIVCGIIGVGIPMDPRDREEDDRGQIEYLKQYREKKEEKEKHKRARKLRKELRRKQICERFHDGKRNHDKE